MFCTSKFIGMVTPKYLHCWFYRNYLRTYYSIQYSLQHNELTTIKNGRLGGLFSCTTVTGGRQGSKWNQNVLILPKWLKLLHFIIFYTGDFGHMGWQFEFHPWKLIVSRQFLTIYFSLSKLVTNMSRPKNYKQTSNFRKKLLDIA